MLLMLVEAIIDILDLIDQIFDFLIIISYGSFFAFGF